MGHEQEFVFDDVKVAPKEGSFIWNSEKREFLGRDGASWAKISFFYAIFYTCLASFFVGMLAVFVTFMPRDIPTYYGESSTMSSRGLNPGLGFRPQPNVEESTIFYDPLTVESPEDGYLKYVRNIKNYLDAKYSAPEDDVIDCKQGESNDEQLKAGKSCKFDYASIFANSPCTLEKSFGYETQTPCVLLKLNKIIGWKPKSESKGVKIRCNGETSSDKDNLISVTYHSEDGNGGSVSNKEEGSLDGKYFPFWNQKSYRAPFIWAQFDIPRDTLVNIECKAFAENIDNEDSLNLRGMTRFTLYIGKTRK